MRGWVIGNGPSKNAWDLDALDGAKYGCNTIHLDTRVDCLISLDPWYQYELIQSGYNGAMKFAYFVPYPIEVPPEITVMTQWPTYSIHEVNERTDAVEYMVYSTSAANYEKNLSNNNVAKYWKPDCAYVCWLRAGLSVSDLDLGILPFGLNPDNPFEPCYDNAPAGAFAIQEALRDGCDELNMIGFDALSGVYSTSSNSNFNRHEELEQGKEWYKFYDLLQEKYNDVEFIWHTKKD